MASKFWVGNGGDWDSISHWSTESGGTPGASVPSFLDDVIFDGNSFNSSGQIVTIDGMMEVKTLTTQDVTNNPTFEFTDVTSVLISHGTLYIPNNVTFSVSGTGTVSIACFKDYFTFYPSIEEGADVQITIGTAGETITLANHSLNIPDAQVDVRGIFSSGNYDITCGTLQIQATGTFDFGTSTIAVNTLNCYAAAENVTIDSASITVGSINTPGLTFGTVTMVPGVDDIYFSGENTFDILIISGTGEILLVGDETQTITTSLQIIGTSSEDLVTITGKGLNYEEGQGNSVLDAASVTLENVSFSNVTGAGTASPFTGTNIVNGGGNMGITFVGVGFIPQIISAG